MSAPGADSHAALAPHPRYYGHHIGDAEDEKTAIQIMSEAIHGGVKIFDNCWKYHGGKAEDWTVKALKGERNRLFLMTKVRTHGRDGSLGSSASKVIRIQRST